MDGKRVYSFGFLEADFDSSPDGVVLESDGYTRRTPVGKQAAHKDSGALDSFGILGRVKQTARLQRGSVGNRRWLSAR